MEKEKKKMGRPTDNPKPLRLAVRVDDETNKKLDRLALDLQTTKAKLIRRGIELVFKENERN